MIKKILIITIILLAFLLNAEVTDMSRFYDYQEIEDSLFAWAEQYPNLAHVESIGTTLTDHLPIWAMKISDNVELNEDEPAILIIGTCHAEEVMGTELVMNNIKEMLTNRDFSPFSYWLNELEVWFVPTMNPEGMRVVMGFYEDNEEVFPSQVGEWIQETSYRKNRRDNNENNLFDYDPNQVGYDIDGVDPNRNYPFNWVQGDTLYAVNIDETELYDYYRGPYPLSENETQAINELAKREKFVYSIHWHSSRSGKLKERIYFPFNWSDVRPSPDLQISQHIGESVALEIISETGNPYEVYASSGRKGNEHDYLYKEYGTFQLLIEAGTSNIQPDTLLMQDQIERTKQGFYWLLNRALRFQYGTNVETHSMLTGHVFDSETGNPIDAEIIIHEHNAEYFSPRLSDEEYGRFWRPLLPGVYTITARKKGYLPVTYPGVIVNTASWSEITLNLDPAPEYTYQGTMKDENGESINGYIVNDYMGVADTLYINNGVFDFTFFEGEHNIEIISDGHISYKGVWTINSNDTNLEIILSSENIVFEEDFESGTNNWDVEGPWVIINDENAAFENNSITDSWGGKGFYSPDCDVHITTSSPIPIPDTDHVMLSFMSSRYTEFEFDSVMVQVSTDNSNWDLLWSGTGQYEEWKLELVNLDNYIGEEIYLRFRLKDISPDQILNPDQLLVDTGWTLDNIKVVIGNYDFVEVEDDTINFPSPKIELENNYPNPFNPVTTFSFNIENTDVKSASIKIYNIKGQKIENLILNQDQIKKGSITWNAKENPSGIYFYKLDVNNNNYGIKKAILLK